MRAFWAAFWDASSKPSLMGVCGTVLLALVQLGVIVLWMTPERVAASEHGLWMSDSWDHSAYVTVEALRMQRGDPEELAVAVVGSSSLRHAFEDHFAFGDRLSSEMGAPVRLHFMPAGGQSIWESALVLDHLPADYRGVVIIGVHPGRAIYDELELTEWVKKPRLGLRSETVLTLEQRLGLPSKVSSGFYFLDHMGFMAARRTAIVRNLLFGPRTYERHGRDMALPLSERGRALIDSGAAETLSHWEEDGDRGAQALQELVSKITARGVEVLLVLSPLHPNVGKLHPEELARFRKMMDDLARNAGARVIDLNGRAKLEEKDFRDIFHLNGDGARERCEDIFAAEVTDALRRVQARAPHAPGAARS